MISLAPQLRRDTHILWVHLLVAFISFYSFNSYAQNGAPCYKPIIGPGTSAKTVGASLASITFTSGHGLENLTNGNTGDYAESTNLLSLLGDNGVSVATASTTYPGGWYAGYVVELPNGTLSANVLSGSRLETYNDGVFQESYDITNGVGISLLSGSPSKLYLSFKTTAGKDFDEVRFLAGSVASVAATVRIYYATAFDPACGTLDNNTVCFDQLAGFDAVVNYKNGLADVLSGLDNPQNIIDGNKSTYASWTLTAGSGLLANSPFVGVTTLQTIYPVGHKAGFIVRLGQNGLLTAGILNNFSIQTYLHGTKQDDVDLSGSGGLLNANLLSGGSTPTQELSIITTKPFNEVRLVQRSGITASLLTDPLRIYYAFESDENCQDCKTPLVSSSTDNMFKGQIITGTMTSPGCGGFLEPPCPDWTGNFGLLLTGGLSNAGNVVGELTDFATFDFPLVGIVGGARITVGNAGTGLNVDTIPRHSFAGFAIQKVGGLVNVGLLQAITIKTYNGTTLQETAPAGSLLGAGLLDGTSGISFIGFKTTKPYNRIQIEIDAGVINVDIGGTLRIFYAFTTLDNDNDGVPNCIDICAGSDAIDSDGDGTPDACDLTCGAINKKSASIDTDGDLLFNNCDLDSDNDGIPDALEDTNGNGDPNDDDADGDGISNYLDLDSDNDGILDMHESGLTPAQISANDPDNNGVLNGQNPVAVTTATLRDTDGDGVPDYLDLDSDNDGINDIIESGYTGLLDANNDGVVDGPDADNDGIQDSADGNDGAFGSATVVAPKDTDGDGVPDYRDLDSDNDGIKDLTESGRPNLGTLDTNNDGVLDGPDADKDGIQDSVDTEDAMFGSPASAALKDTDGDSVPDYRDLDSDNDGIKDLYESGLPNPGTLDPDGNGVINLVADTDNDGIQDSVDEADGTFGSPGGPALKDTDRDSVPDYLDLDSDNDGIKDLYESGLPNLSTIDTDKNGVIDTGTDADQDGIQDSVDKVTSGPGAFGSTDLPTPLDTDGDTVPDYRDLDSDNDGINDIVENRNPSVVDADNNGMVDGADNDKDGILGGADTNDALFGSPNSHTPVNSDNDPLPDFQDLDSDNDSISDLVESGLVKGGANGYTDNPEDGVVDGPDTDGDGIQDSVDGSPNTFGDANSPAPKNTDGTDTPDYIDTDSDNNGTKDIVSNGKGGLDPNGDGMVDNPDDPDNDGIANNEGLDQKPTEFGGLGPAAGLPDLEPTIATNSGIYVQNQQRDMVITISNVSANATTAPVEFEISKIFPAFTISISPNATTSTVSGEPTVTNDDWNIIEQGGRFLLTLKGGLPMPGNSTKKIVIQVTASNNAKANARITVNISFGTGGGETPTTNNTAIYGLNIE